MSLSATVVCSGGRVLAAEDVNNAAPIYAKVFEGLPAEGSPESEIVDDADAVLLEGPVVRFLMAQDETAQALRRAGSRGRCDWPENAGGEMLKKVRALSDLERLRVRWAIEQERFDDAIAEGTDVLVFAHFIGRVPSSAARMAANRIAEEMTAKIANCLPVASDKSLADLQKRINALPRWFNAAEVTDGEGKRIISELKRLDLIKSSDLFAESSILYDLTGTDHPDDALRTQIQQLWNDPANRLAAITSVSSRYMEAAKIVATPRRIIAKAADDWDQKRRKDDVLTRAVVSSGKTLLQVQLVCLLSDVRAAMLQAALTGRISGTDAALKTLDPSTGKAFKLREWKEGFELQSDLVDTTTDKPLKITVGKAEKLPF